MNAHSLTSQAGPGSAGNPVYQCGSSAKRPVGFLHQTAQFLVITLLAVASYFLISRYVLQSVQVAGSSMWPTLHDADRYLLNRWVYEMRTPRRGEIVVLKDPTDGAYCVKRVVALPGESVFFKNGRLFVNGEELHEPYLLPGVKTFTPKRVQVEWVACGKDRYFVLGDNRNNSFDSRFYGPVSRQNILGVVMR